MARNEQFLPAGSRIAVKQKNAPAAWYTTNKEVVLTAPPVEGTCPMTGQPVVTATAHGLPIWFLPNMIRTRIVLDTGDVDEAVFSEQFSLFHYDVPTANGYTNPSNRLYPIAVRLTESAWMMRTSDIPYELMAEMQDAGCSVEVNKFDKSESRRLIHQAVGKIREELAEAVRRAQASLVRADRALETATEGEEPLTPEEAQKKHVKQAEAIEKRLTLLAGQIEKAAVRFGIREQALNVERLRSTANTIGNVMRERAQAYAAAQRLLAASADATAAALARGAQDNAQNKVPAYVLVDALMDAGHDEEAQRLNAAFSEEETGDVFDLV